MRIFLVGYMGSGKTGTGKEVAARAGCSFLDVDEMIEEKCRISILDMFEKYGEDTFRKIERSILLETLDIPDIVIATGCGTPCFFDIMELIMQSGTCVYLKMEPDELVKRLSAIRKKRPLLKDKNREELDSYVRFQLSEREAIYQRAHHVVRQGSGAVSEILRIIGTELK